MAQQNLLLKIKPRSRAGTVTIELDAARFERLAANLGFFSDEFLSSLIRAEREVTRGRTKKLSNLRDLRRR